MPLQNSNLPPCIVLGLDTQIGLSIVRELGRAGVPVIGIAHDEDAIGLASRYIRHKRIVKAPRSPELIRTIKALGDEFGACCLIAVSEANLIWLAAMRDDFGQIRPIVPSPDSLAVVLDKQRTLQAARAVGIAVPESVEPRSMGQMLTLAAEFKYPAVLKWKDPNHIEPILSAHGLELHKAEYIYGAEQMLTVARRYEPIGAWPVVQTYCPGRGLGQFFFMRDGQAVRRFQHVRVAEWPPEGGFSSVCDSVSLDRHVKLQERSIALLRSIGWEGVAMVEYRWDEATDKALLMEINGRYWGSYPLALHCHANFALISYFLENNIELPELDLPRTNRRCRMISTELKRLVRILVHPELIADRTFKIRRWFELLRFFGDYFRPSVCYYVWDHKDPLPFLTDVRNLLQKRFKRTPTR